MKIGPAVWVVSLLSFSLAAEAAPSVAAANEKLESARTSLGKAVERIKQDPPSNADLDAAAAAVEALKEAIDFGADLEQSDLDYARSALAARKELRTQREYVDQRRANIKIFDARRAIDAQLKPLNEQVAGLQGKDPGPKGFDDARAAANALKKVVDDARPFAKQDAAFAKYVGEVDATIAKHLKAIDDRQTLLAVEKQRAVLDEGRAALKSALASVGKEATDAQFEAGDKASKDLAKRLEDGKALEPKNAGYKGEADKARAELAQAKKKMDDAWTATGLQRLKAEVEPAYKDLQAAAKPVKGGKPTPDQLAEAKTAAIVVRKLVEKFAAEAERSQAFGQYMTQVKKTLAEVETEIEKRTLGAAQLDVVNAQRAVDKKAPPPSDEDFQVLATSISVLEKTLGAVHKDEPLMAKSVADAQWALKGAKESAAKRRVEVDSDNEKKTLATAQADVVTAQRAVDKKTPAPTDDEFKELATAISVLEKTLGTVHKDQPLMTKAVADAEAVLKSAKETAAKRRVEVDSDNEKQSLTTAQRDVGNAQRAVEKKSPTDEEFQVLNTAITVLEKTLGTVHQKEPLMAKAVADAQWALKTAKEVAVKRRLEVDVDRQKAKVEEARKIASDAMAALNAPAFGQEQLDSAEKSIKLIGTVLEGGSGLLEKDKGYAAYDREVKTRIKELEGKLAAKRVLFAANTARTGLGDGVASAKAKIAAAQAPEGKDSDLDAATQAVDALTKSVEGQTALEKQNGAYAAQAEKTRNALYQLVDLLEMAKQSRELRKRTGETFMTAAQAVDAGGATPDLRKRKAEYVKAIGMFKGCASDGQTQLTMYPMLAKIPVLVDGKTSTPREVMAQCTARAEATEALMKEVVPLIKFDDGPKKSYEAGKSLLDKSKKNEALAQFNECIATGIILQHDNPELTDKQFTVAGSNMTLGEVIKQCVNNKKAIAGK